MIDKAVWGPAVLAGLPGAALSSALSSLSNLWRDLAKPKGFVRLLGLIDRRSEPDLEQGLADLARRLEKKDLFVNWTVVQTAPFHQNLAASLEALGSTFFTSNLLFLRLPDDGAYDYDYRALIESASEHQLAVLLYVGNEPSKETVGPVAVWINNKKMGGG
jgi:solute carrier family 12 sodium/potassium/chloride transporter 2